MVLAKYGEIECEESDLPKHAYMYVERQQEKGVLKHVRETTRPPADFSFNFTLFLDASLIIFSPHAR